MIIKNVFFEIFVQKEVGLFGAGHATDKSIRFSVPGKTRNSKTFEKSCDSCNRIQNVFVSMPEVFSLFFLEQINFQFTTCMNIEMTK